MLALCIKDTSGVNEDGSIYSEKLNINIPALRSRLKSSRIGWILSGVTKLTCLALKSETGRAGFKFMSIKAVGSKARNVFPLTVASMEIEFNVFRSNRESIMETSGPLSPRTTPPGVRVCDSVATEMLMAFCRTTPDGEYEERRIVSEKERLKMPELRSKPKLLSIGPVLSLVKVRTSNAMRAGTGMRGLNAVSSPVRARAERYVLLSDVARRVFLLISLTSGSVIFTSSTLASIGDLLTSPPVKVKDSAGSVVLSAACRVSPDTLKLARLMESEKTIYSNPISMSRSNAVMMGGVESSTILEAWIALPSVIANTSSPL